VLSYFVFLRLVYHMLPVSPNCQILIAPSVFSKVYLYRMMRNTVLIFKTLLLNMTILTFYLLIFLFLLHLELQHIQEKIDDLMKVLEDTNQLLMSYLGYYLCLFANSGVKHILCYHILFFFVLCTICCQFLRIVKF
jgi:hypothetical protein